MTSRAKIKERQRYELSTVINGEIVNIRCNEASARILLPLWVENDPNQTVCFDTETGLNIVCFDVSGHQ